MAKTHRAWTPEEDYIVMNSTASVKEIAAVLGRTVAAVYTRRAKLTREQMKSPQERQASIDKQHENMRIHKERVQTLMEATEGMNFTPEQISYIKIAIKKKLDIRPMLNPAFNPFQMKEIAIGLRSGVDVSVYADPKYNSAQMSEIRLGMEHGVNTEWFQNPAFSCDAMRQIRYGLETGLAVQYYANPCYTCDQMKQLREALRERLPVWKLANPAYQWEQMYILRRALRSDIDISTFSDPSLSAKEMEKRFIVLRDKFRAVYLTRSERPKPSNRSLEDLDYLEEPFIIHCRSDAHARELLKRLEMLGYSWGNLKANSSGTYSSVYFQCFPKEKRVRSNPNKPKNGDFITYLALKENMVVIDAALPEMENWVSLSQGPPSSAGIYRCLVRDTQTSIIQERMLEYSRNTEGKLRFLLQENETVLTWMPHVARQQRYQKLKQAQTEAQESITFSV